MSRKKLFIENIFAYGFIQTLNKIVPFILLPVITRMLPNTSDFGIFNMYNLVVGFGTPFVILGIYDAMFREYFEKDDQQYKYNVTTTAQRIVLLSSIIISIVLMLFSNKISFLLFRKAGYENIIILAGIGIFLGSNLNPIQSPTRMQNQKKVFIVSGLLSSIVTYSLSVLLIYYGYSYFGLIYSSIITSIVLLSFFWIRNKQFFLKGSFNISIAKELFKIGLPLLPTFLIYWVYNSMDKIMITTMLGTHELGIYSIGAKVAQISQLVYAAFAGGWQYFAFSTMKDEDQIELNSKVFEYLGTISVLSLILIYPFIQCTFSFLFVGDYIKGYLVAPYLYLSPLLLMLFQVVANQFLVIKKSYFATVSLSIGAVINVVLNYFLIRQLGIEGAAISTLIGYLVTLITVMIVSKRMKCMFYSKRIIIVLLMIPLYFYLQRGIFLSNVYMQITTMTSMAAILCVIFRKEIMIILVKLKRFGN